jgi:DNA-binding MarR family transcriptional regulator
MTKSFRSSRRSHNRNVTARSHAVKCVSESHLVRDLASRDFIAELFATVAGMQSLRRAIARSIGLGGTEFAILLAIWRLGRPGSIGIKGLAEQLHVAGPHVTEEVTRLVQPGYLRKSPDLRDTRAIIVKLSSKGTTLLASLAPVLDRINLHLFEGVTTKDMLRILFQRLIDRSASSVYQLHVG